MPSGKILYFVRPEAKRPRQESDFHPSQQYARTVDDEIARRQFDDLVKGIWPTSSGRSA